MTVPALPWTALADEHEPVPPAVAPLRELFVRVHERFPGNVLEVELEQEEHGRRAGWVYEVKLLTADGRVLKLFYDAASLEMLEVKGRGREDDD